MRKILQESAAVAYQVCRDVYDMNNENFQIIFIILLFRLKIIIVIGNANE